MSEVYRYGRTVVEIFNGFVRTTLPDGTPVHAVPGETAEDVARAHSLGYRGDVWAMTRDHDRIHALLAHAFGLEESPALRATVEGRQSELAGAEECAVLAIQRWVNLVRASAAARGEYMNDEEAEANRRHLQQLRTKAGL